ncbi:hypothetical protein PLESTB_001746500 [Pleodorina starrii]|uniref:BTB domain-containing protein n=1 Tax=Pleodorina starrii TaxID=330485 RepID=A0A9W6BZX2_9CHLO|nr:hypothetical protein PLESTM_001672800 [Pleodorina starrii]GLC61352.1 hypothetical protein PLESTB_001746500 [Pleodorina starrii]GLC69336.1 hypothetical protein PLESTF_000818300 [Pleodorina starrii]
MDTFRGSYFAEMTKRKLDSSDLAYEEEAPDLRIFVAGRDEPFSAHRDLLKFYSLVIRGLPCAAADEVTTWDLRGVVLEDETQPVSADVVKAWLDIIYSRTDVARPGSPPSSLRECVSLLKFADFAQTSVPLLREIAGRFAEDARAFVEVILSMDCRPRLLLHDCSYSGPSALGLYQTSGMTGVESRVLVPAAALDLPRIRAATSADLEAALYLAARLDLPPLIALLRSFIRAQLLMFNKSRVIDLATIYSARVLNSLPRQVLLEGFLESSLVGMSEGVDLEGGVKGVFKSGLVAGCFGRRVGDSTADGEMSYAQVQGVGLVLKQNINGRGMLHLTPLLGGLAPEERQTMVTECMARAAAAAAGSSRPGGSSRAAS